jgi:alginate O-acetyltransferase complex protein AlgJ
MRLTRHPLIIVFLALSLAPAALIGINGPWLGGGERPFLRAPAAFPEKFTPGAFRRASMWFNDRIGMRYPLMVLDSYWRLTVWRLRFRGDVLFGNGSWLFLNDAPPVPAARRADLRGTLRMAEADIARLDRQMATTRAQFAACGKTAFIAIAPNKQSIYPDELRDGSAYPTSRLDDVLARLGPDARSMVIDPRPELRASKSRHGVPNYFPTDTHWNDLGAFIAYQKIVAALAQANAIANPQLATLDGVSVHVENTAGGDIATRMLFLAWNFPDQHVLLRGVPAAQLTTDSQHDRTLITNPQGSGKLLIFGDSFAGPLASLLARHFAEVELLSRPTWPAAFDGEMVARRRADVAIIEIAERSLPELLQPPARLERVCAGG